MPRNTVTSPLHRSSAELGTRALALLIAVAFVSLWIYKVVIPETRQFKFDFAPYYAAWYAAHAGHPFYEAETGEAGLHGEVFADLRGEMGIDGEFSAYIYPPQFAWMGSWIASIPYGDCQVAWVWFSAGLWLLCVGLLLGRALWEQPLVSALLMAASLIYPSMAYSLSLGQINILLFALIVASWRWVRSRWDVPAGVAIAIAALIKPHIGLLIVYFLWTRRWRAAISCLLAMLLITAASLISLGVEPFQTYVFDVLPRISAGQAYIANQSAYGVLARVFTADPQYLFEDRLMPPHALLDALSVGLSIAIVALTLWAIPSRRDGGTSVSLGFAAIICGLLLANKIATIHHFTWMWLGISVIVTESFRGTILRRPAEKISFALGVLLLFATWKFFGWFNGQAGTLRLLACNTFAGTVLIWWCLLAELRRTKARTPLASPG